MNCSECGIPSKDATRQCWKQFGLCVKCAVTAHPEMYPDHFVSRYTGMSPPRKPLYKLCGECGDKTSRLYHHNLGHKRVGCWFCKTCRIISVYDPDIRVVTPLEVPQ